MSITSKIDNLSQTKRRINITVPVDEIVKYKNKAFQKIGKSAKINGFRPGKIPSNVLEKYYGAELNYECMNFLISETYTSVLKEHSISPIGDPKFDAGPIETGDYSYSIEIEVRPDIGLKDYKKLKISKKEVSVKEKEIDEELKQLQESLAQLAPAPEGATLKSGLVATIDFDGTLEGKKFEGGSAKDYVFEFGKGQLLQEFEGKIEGMMNLENRDIEITFPKDYFEKSLASKNAQYKITLKNLHIKTLPQLDDELAKDIGKQNLAEVREEIKKGLIRRKEQDLRGEYAEEIQKQLIKEHKFELPQNLVAAEIERRKIDKDKVEEQIRLQLILEEISRKESITPTQQDVEARFKMMSQMYRQPVQEIQKIYMQNNLMSSLVAQIAMDKTLDFIIDSVIKD